MRGVLPGVTFQQLRHRVQQEREQQAVRLGEIERSLEGVSGSLPLTERVPGARRPMDRRSPVFIGMAGAAGVAITIAVLELAIRARSVLVLIGLALFTSTLVVIALVVYFLAGMPQIRLFFYRLAPASRRARVILLGDDIFTKVGGFVLGNVVTSVIAGLGTYLWMLALGIPYPILLGLFVALLDLIPVIGSTIGGAIVSLVALTVSLPVAIATLAFYIGYRLFEDYVLTPRIMGGAVKVPAVVSVVAVLVGGALLGIIGALVAIPVAAALRLLLEEVMFRRLDRI